MPEWLQEAYAQAVWTTVVWTTCSALAGVCLWKLLGLLRRPETPTSGGEPGEFCR